MSRSFTAIPLIIITITAAVLVACSVRPPPPPAPVVKSTGDPITISFDDMPVGQSPVGFHCAWPGPDGVKPARWIIEQSIDAAHPGRVLIQADGDDTNNRFPVALVEGKKFSDVRVAVSAQAVSGTRDRSFGVVVRAVDERNYYVARANTSGWGENVRLYKMVDGKRSELDEWQGPVAPNAWHRLEVEAVGSVFSVSLDGKQIFRVKDETFPAAGLVGVWTKAEAISRFDNLTITPVTP